MYRLLFVLVSISLISICKTATSQEIVFTDENCCVLLDTKLSNEMDVAPQPFPDGYVAQLGGPDPTYVAEYRETYGENWRPKQSIYRGPREGGTHGGIDIYAPSVPGPVRIPIVAPVGGKALMKPDDGNEKLGNRVWIEFEFGGEPFVFHIGHMTAFEGSDRDVTANEIIGYAGCTGNADDNGDCTNANTCGLTSGHVHYQLKNRQTGKMHNPAQALRWKLRYGENENVDPCTKL